MGSHRNRNLIEEGIGPVSTRSEHCRLRDQPLQRPIVRTEKEVLKVQRRPYDGV